MFEENSGLVYVGTSWYTLFATNHVYPGSAPVRERVVPGPHRVVLLDVNIEEIRDIARGVDIGHVRSQVLVGHDALAQLHAGARKELRV